MSGPNSPNPDEPMRPDSFIDAVAETLRRYRMLQEGASVLVAVSAGPDSTALLHALVRLAPRIRLRLGVAHLHHGLRGEAADADAAFVDRLSRTLGLPCHRRNVDVRSHARRARLSLETAGRELRYAFFDEVARDGGYDRIATGHHADDNAEQMLMALIRGSGPTGLAGIPPVRKPIIRPFIDLRRAAIRDYLATHGHACREDETNADAAHFRNRVRHKIIPALRAENPRIVETLNRTAAVIREENDHLNADVDAVYDRVRHRPAPDMLTLDPADMGALPLAVARRLIRRAVADLAGDTRRLTLAHVDSVLALAGRSGDRRLDLPRRIRATRESGRLRLQRLDRPLREAVGDRPVPAYAYPVTGVGSLVIPETGASVVFSEIPADSVPPPSAVEATTAYFDAASVRFPLTIRNRRPGDRITPLGMTGTRKLGRLLTDAKVPGSDRDRLPLLVSGETVLWVAGIRRSAVAPIRPDTERALQVELFLA